MNKKEFYHILNSIVGAERLSNEEIYIINDYISTLEQENKQLRDNWNKLNEYIKDKYMAYEKEILDFFFGYRVCLLSMRDKIQELENGENDEKKK